MQKDSAGQALYPYVNKNPGEDQGALKVCYQGKADGGDYDVYYGYESCNSNQSQGGVWKQDETNAQKCVCDRKNNLVSPLPFDSLTFFATNRDTSNNYSRVGFGKGAYGAQNSCTDSEGTYYGYSSCYLGRRLGTIDATKGMCLTSGCDGRRTKYAYYFQGISSINEIIKAETDNLMSEYPTVTQAIDDKLYNDVWQSGETEDLKDIPNVPNIGQSDALTVDDSNNGQRNTVLIMAYKRAHPEVYLSLAESAYSYAPNVCVSVEMCQKGQWFLPVLGEVQYIFEYRYVLYNVLGDAALLNGNFFTANERSYRAVWASYFSDASQNEGYKNRKGYMYPMLAF